MITNAQETQLVKSLGVSIEGKEGPSQPFQLVRSSLAREGQKFSTTEETNSDLDEDAEDILWTNDAKKRMEKVPEFIRFMAGKAIENHARQKGYKEITPEVIDEAKAHGMG